MEDAERRVPRLSSDAGVTALPIGPEEGYILGIVDGVLTVSEIAEVLSLPLDTVAGVLDRLSGLGAIEWSLRPERPRPPSARPPPAAGTPKPPASDPSSQRLRYHTVQTKPPPPGTSRVLYDPIELEEEIDLDVDWRRQVLDTFYRLEETSHYELLGIPQEADKKEIRDAYFKLSKVFHPDTVFAKNVGSYKQKMEAIFQRLTEAYEVLGKKKKREEYDAYLGIRKRTRGAERMLEEGRKAAEALRREAAAEDAKKSHPDARAVPEPTAPETKPAEPPPPLREKPAPLGAERQEEMRRQKRALFARKLAQVTGREVPGTPIPPPPPGDPKVDREAMLLGLKRSIGQSAQVTRGAQRLDRYLADAQEAEGREDFIGAANSLRLALTLLPDSEELRKRYEEANRKVAAELADSYAKQAEYEESNQLWSEAALSWARVADGRPNEPDPPRRAALALVKAGADLRRARELAQKAVDLEPRQALSRRTLGEVYLAAGLKLNAKRELEAAAKLDPKDEIVKNLLRELRE